MVMLSQEIAFIRGDEAGVRRFKPFYTKSARSFLKEFGYYYKLFDIFFENTTKYSLPPETINKSITESGYQIRYGKLT
jgi:hypothetical protein